MTDANATLDQSQKILEQHFSELAATRAQRDADVFALEHGLSPEQLKNIFETLHTNLRLGQRLSPHWLLWVVYAAELGYDYDGREYWPSFEERTPYWIVRGDPKLIRQWYNKFQTTYRGIKPTGKWANWFRNIAGPITHAVLPKDLQIRLARALYDQRFRLAALPLRNARDVGQLLAQRTTDASSRFSIFLEQEELVGRIVLALLQGPGNQTENELLPTTLARIVADLERTRNAREWLHDARHAIEKTRLHGVGAHTTRSGPKPAGESAEKDEPPSTKPVFSLRRRGPDVWTAVLHLPNFGSVAALNPDLKAFLRATRVCVTGGEGWKPGGWLLFGAQHVVLVDWPVSGQPLIGFERPNAIVEHLIRGEASMPDRAVHVFKVGSDGIARELSTRVVRPGSTYVLLHRDPLPPDTSQRTCQVTCRGTYATELVVPAQAPASFEAHLRKLGLALSKTFRIWPAGLPARSWDGEGRAEWLAQEEVCIGIGLDHQLDGIRIELADGQQPLHIRSPSSGKPLFISLGQPSSGVHCLKVAALKGFDSFSSVVAEGSLSIHIRPPEPWVPGSTSHCGLVVTCDPNEPSLDDFWNGIVQLSALGPEGRNVRCALELLGGANEVLKLEPVGAFPLPITGSSWARQYPQAVKGWQKRDPWSYLAASHGRLVIDGDELGRFPVHLAREVVPLRWISKTASQRTTVRLLDDTGVDTPPIVTFYDFAHPIHSEHRDGKECLAGVVPTWPGGLYVATSSSQSQGLVVSLPEIEGGLQGLSIQMAPGSLPGDRASVLPLLVAADLWTEAKLCGPLALARRDHVLKLLYRQLFRIVCGGRWTEAEDWFEREHHSPSSLQRLEEAIGKPLSFAISVNQARGELCALPAQERINKFTDLAKSFSVSTDGGLCEAALRLSAQPHRFRAWAGESAALRIKQLFDCAVLVRASRFVAVVGASEDSSLLGALGRGWDL